MHPVIEQLRAVHAQDPAAVRALLGEIASADGRDPHSLQLNVNVTLELRGPNGELRQRQVHNTICTAGKNLILASGGTAKYVKDYAYVLAGTGTTAASAADTALETETVRALGTVSNPSANTLRVTYTIPAGAGTGAITEAGLDYQNSASGAILARQVFSAINKGAADSLTVTFDIT